MKNFNVPFFLFWEHFGLPSSGSIDQTESGCNPDPDPKQIRQGLSGWETDKNQSW
jgi:hypothetical protein